MKGQFARSPGASCHQPISLMAALVRLTLVVCAALLLAAFLLGLWRPRTAEIREPSPLESIPLLERGDEQQHLLNSNQAAPAAPPSTALPRYSGAGSSARDNDEMQRVAGAGDATSASSAGSRRGPKDELQKSKPLKATYDQLPLHPAPAPPPPATIPGRLAQVPPPRPPSRPEYGGKQVVVVRREEQLEERGKAGRGVGQTQPAAVVRSRRSLHFSGWFHHHHHPHHPHHPHNPHAHTPMPAYWAYHSSNFACPNNGVGYCASCAHDLTACMNHQVALGYSYVVWYANSCYGMCRSRSGPYHCTPERAGS